MGRESKTIKTGKLFRNMLIEAKRADGAGTIDEEKRTVQLAFSSEEPYERFFGIEILDHAPESLRLGRLNDGGALLLGHDPDRHVGVVEQVAIGEDRIGRALVRFGRSEEAQAAFQDVADGIRRHVSVGYIVHSMELEKESEGKGTYRVTDWEPLEISLVSIPADPTVGVGRGGGDLEVHTRILGADAPDPQPEPQQPKRTIHTMKPIHDKDGKPLEGEAAERERARQLLDLGKQYGAYIGAEQVAEAIRNGTHPDAFRDKIMEAMQTKHADTSALRIGMGAREVQRYSIARAVVAAMTGDWRTAGLERAASQAVAKIVGQEPAGFFVPYDAFQRDFNVGTGTEAGNLVATELRTDLFVDVLRNNLVLGSLGIRILAGLSSNIDIPRKTVAGTLAMVTEIAALSETQPNTGKVSLTPKRMGAFVEYSKQALIQSAIAVEPMLRDDLMQGAAVLLQDQVINGVGTGANMRGIRNTVGVGSVVGGANGAAVSWAHLVDLESACANVNAEPDRLSGYCTNTKVRGATKKTQKGSNLPFIWDGGAAPLNGYRAAITNTVPSNLTKGTSTTIASSILFGSDWSMSVLGLFGAPDVTVDPYTLATVGQVRITLNQFGDHGVRLPAAFAVMDDALTP